MADKEFSPPAATSSSTTAPPRNEDGSNTATQSQTGGNVTAAGITEVVAANYALEATAEVEAVR